MPKTITIIANGFTKKNVSGGDKNFIEIAKYILYKKKYNIEIITHPIGKIVCQQNIPEKISYKLTDNYSKSLENPLKIIWWYLKRGYETSKIVKEKNSTFILASDFYCDTLSLFSLKKKSKVVIFNMVARNPFYGYKQKMHFPDLSEIHYFLSNLLTFSLLNIFANSKNTKIVATAKNIEADLRNSILKKTLKEKIKVINYGSDIEEFEKIKNLPNKDTDFVWIGRNHPQKGLEDLKKILLIFRSKKTDFSIKIIGDLGKSFEDFVVQNNLQENVFLTGKLFNQEKIKALASSKVFLFTSHFESFGIVVLENFLVKNLVIGYRIPSSLYNFGERLELIQNFDYQQFAFTALEKIESLDRNKKILNDNYKFAIGFSWAKTGQAYLEIIENF